MNLEAERHLAKAEGYLAKGDGWYAKAADEIIAAREADDSLGYREIGKRFGKSDNWARSLVTWRTSANARSSPFAEVTRSSSDRSAAKRVLDAAPLEQVEQMLSELSPERQRAIAAAAGDQYLKARQDFEEEERRMTPSERKQREAAADAITEAGRRAAGGFASLGIGGHLEQATEDARELVADHAVTVQTIELIEPMHRAWCEEWEVMRAMAGLETDREAVER